MDDDFHEALRKFLDQRLSKSKLRRRERRSVLVYCTRTVQRNSMLFNPEPQQSSVMTFDDWQPWFIAFYHSALLLLGKRSERIVAALRVTIEICWSEQVLPQSAYDEIIKVLSRLPCDERMKELAVARLEKTNDEQCRTRFNLSEYELNEHDRFLREILVREVAYHSHVIAFCLDRGSPVRLPAIVKKYLRMQLGSRLRQLKTWRALVAKKNLNAVDHQFVVDILNDLAAKAHRVPDPDDVKDINALLEILRPHPSDIG